MKDGSVGNLQNGFSMIEIVIALAIITLILGGVVLVNFGVQYWVIDSQTSNEALYKVTTRLEDVIASSRKDFYSAISSSLIKDEDSVCLSGGLCYFLQSNITDISPCEKYATADVSWQVAGYPQMSTSFFYSLSNVSEAINLGGDCGLNYPSGPWTNPNMLSSYSLGAGNTTGVDVLNGVSYIVKDQGPYMQVVTAQGLLNFSNGFTGSDIYNAIDVARNQATGRTYAYVAAKGEQLQIIDVTDLANPVLAGHAYLNGVSKTSAQEQGWRIAYYGSKVYIATRYNSGAAEFHIFDVLNPLVSLEIGSGTHVNTSIYGIIIRDQMSQGSLHRFAYLATTSNAREVLVLDVTDSNNIKTAASCDLQGDYDGTYLYILGNILYMGRQSVPNGGADVYAFDATDPLSATFCTPLGQTDITTDSYVRHVIGIKASGPYLFLATTNSTNSHGQLQIRNADPKTNFALIGKYDILNLADNSIDVDNNDMYAVSTSTPILQVLYSP